MRYNKLKLLLYKRKLWEREFKRLLRLFREEFLFFNYDLTAKPLDLIITDV